MISQSLTTRRDGRMRDMIERDGEAVDDK